MTGFYEAACSASNAANFLTCPIALLGTVFLALSPFAIILFLAVVAVMVLLIRAMAFLYPFVELAVGLSIYSLVAWAACSFLNASAFYWIIAIWVVGGAVGTGNIVKIMVRASRERAELRRLGFQDDNVP